MRVAFDALELRDAWLDSDPSARWRLNVALSEITGTESCSLIYFELDPGCRLARHTDSAEEILYIVSGTAEAEVGDEVGLVRAGDLAVIPAMVPHGLRNVGELTVKVVGFFSHAVIYSEFEEPLQPIGQTVLPEMAPIPVAA